MDVLTHSLLGLTAAKAGLERFSPYATAVCILSANAPDIDVVAGFFGDRWTVLQHHRGITHSIVGTLGLGLLLPSIFWVVERAFAKWRRRRPRIYFRGLVLASLIAAATHPLMDWTNNYGVRPLLPWSGHWFYGDLVFIVDPYLWMLLGGAAFLVTSDRWAKVIAWGALGIAVSLLVFLAPAQRGLGEGGIGVVRAIWSIGILIVIIGRAIGLQQRRGRLIPICALVVVVCYWGALTWTHRLAYRDSVRVAQQFSTDRGEQFIQAAAMPTVANPFRWLCVAETDRAMYRFFVGVGPGRLPIDSSTVVTDGSRANSPGIIERYEKPIGLGEQLVSQASADRRARILLGFARFPMARVDSDNCIGQTLVQFADLRYTEPGASRGNFSVNVPVECPAP
jgi:inner membrane protein